MFSKKLFFCAIGIALFLFYRGLCPPSADGLFAATTANAYYNPGNPTGYINDFTKTLNTATIQQLNSELAAFEKQTSHQIFVAIIPSMKGDYIEYFAVKLFEDWKPGQKKPDNGILFLISLEEHATKIEVGYGLEGILPDTKAKNILDNIAKPYFKAGDFDAGVIQSVRAIESIIKGEVVDFSQQSTSTKSMNLSDYIEIIFVWGLWFLMIASRFLVNIFAKTKSWWLGGVMGGTIGIILGLFLFSMIGYWVLWIFFFLAGGGFLLDYLASTGKIKPGKGSGGFWFFGGGGGGGFGGGGFGGGGGGSSGGGGASGGW
ncbi:TPM domain-containing protein [Candidatus Peregrinibacteria bacterium]|nr:TPM domain-containing protein [Candidatus Peregrinibacteria bacterium]